MFKHSPYLESSKRLADVMAAIQYLATHKFGSRTVENWSGSIGSSPKSADSWKTLFEEHPEFFRVKEGYVALVWRRANQKNFNMDTGKTHSKEQIKALSSDEKKLITRKPLEPAQTEALLNSAIQMHAAAIAHKKEFRWWIPLIASLLGVVVGAILK